MTPSVTISLKLTVQLTTVPASARIKVNFPNGLSSLFDPESSQWHRADGEQPEPNEILHRFTIGEQMALKAFLQRYGAQRFNRIKNSKSHAKRIGTRHENGGET